MTQTSGWGLTARLLSKHFGVMGNRVAEAIALFDPETATEADRDQLHATLEKTATQLAIAQSGLSKKTQDVTSLQTLVANDEKAVDVLLQRLTAGTIAESAVSAFCDELEANKLRLPLVMQAQDDASAYKDELQKLVDLFSSQLAEFDAAAKKALAQISNAQAQKGLQQARADSQAQLQGLSSSASNSSTALAALARRAQGLSDEAAGMKIVTDLQQKPIDQAADIDAIRRSVAQGTSATESTADRLRRLSNKPAAAAETT